jgi:hypothetical protein
MPSHDWCAPSVWPDLVIRSREACPRATLSRISSAGFVQTKGSGLSFQWKTLQSIPVSSSATEVKPVWVKACG